MSAQLDPSTGDTVRSCWASKLHVPRGFFEDSAVHLVERVAMTAAVVVQLHEATVVLAPPSAASALTQLDGSQLVDMPTLLRALANHEPRSLGSAFLAYGDAGTLCEASNGTQPATDSDVEMLLAACTPADRDESGVADMPFRVVTTAPDGIPAALAGYEPWGSTLAQLGVLVHPKHRRRGLARVTSSTSVNAALRAGLIPQWRCRLDNEPSALLSRRLGLIPLGRQLAAELEARQFS